MSGNDDDSRNELDKWVKTQREEIKKIQDELWDRRDDLQKDLRDWTDGASSSLRSPFERFKSFVDSNFTLLSEGFRNFPSNISELKANMQAEREARKAEEREIWRRWTGSEDSPDHIRMQVERLSKEERLVAKDATYMLLRAAFERNRNVSSQKILDLYRDAEWSFGGLDQFANPRLSFGGACYYKPETIENLPSTARWGWTNPAPRWLSVDWFKRSPYSPINVEKSVATHNESKWRAAFEDLLCVALDKPMISEERVGVRMPYGRPQSTYYGPGLDWMLSLQCRGILPPQLPSLYKPVSVLYGFDEVNGPRVAQFWHDVDEITSSRSGRLYPMVNKDFDLLIDEVAIKSSPETEAEPLSPRFSQKQLPWQVPDTEQDLYDQMLPLAVPEGPWVPVMTGNRQDDLDDADDALWTAAYEGDVDTAKKCIEAFYTTYGDVGDLVRKQLDEFYDSTDNPNDTWFPTLNAALRQSNLPLDNVWKRSAFCNKLRGQVTNDTQELKTRQCRMPETTGDRLADGIEAWQALWEAISDGDVETATKCINRYHSVYEDVSDLLRLPLTTLNMTPVMPSCPVLNEAVIRSDLPESDTWKRFACNPDRRYLEAYEGRTPEELQQERDLMRRGDIAAGEAHVWPINWSLQELEQRVLEMENRVAKPATPRSDDSVKRPDILSRLTTTQTTRLPDGTVTTKVVMKQRFADGREETHESEQTTHEQTQDMVAEEETKKKEKKGGWFWS